MTQVTNFKNLAPLSSWQQLKDAADDVMFRWAHVEAVAPIVMGGGAFDQQKLAFLEKYFGYQLTPRDANGVPSESNIAELIDSWNTVLGKETLRLAAQGPLAAKFAGLTFDLAKDVLVASSPTSVADVLKSALLTLSTSPATALLQWNSDLGPMMAEMLHDTQRSDGNNVRTDYAVQALVKALDGTAQPLSLTQLVNGRHLNGVQIGTAGNDTMDRGLTRDLQVYVGDAGNDTINGGIGQDVYVYGRNFGQDTITDVEGAQNGDRIRFSVLNENDVTMKRVGTDLVIEVNNSTDKITVKDQFADPEVNFVGVQITPNYGVEKIQFASGKIFEAGDIAAAVGQGTSGADILIGTGQADELEGFEGDDLLKGGDGGDTYYFGRGYGHDTIQDIQTNPLLNAGDALVLVNGLSAKDIAISRVGSSFDVTLSIIGSPNDTVLIKDQFEYSPLGFNTKLSIENRMEAIFFSIGTSWSWTDLQQKTIET